MKRSELYFNLPKQLIAQTPATLRDNSRLMILNSVDQTIKHDNFFNLCNYVKSGDVLVFNQSKVLPARLLGQKQTGGKVELLLLRDLGKGSWQVMLRGGGRPGQKIIFGKSLVCEVVSQNNNVFEVRFNIYGKDFFNIVKSIGHAPTPPYIKTLLKDSTRYQTVYAKDKDLGSAATPTAGLHFTQELLAKLTAMGVQQEFVTLHVGLGTFQPIKEDVVENHNIHSEWYSADNNVVKRILIAKKEGRRIIAVGTTSIRVLETLFSVGLVNNDSQNLKSIITGETKLFIYPGYKFQIVDAMITNFHTPYSSLLALVYAFAGQEFIQKAYQEAITKKYRFFSFGDALFICRN